MKQEEDAPRDAPVAKLYAMTGTSVSKKPVDRVFSTAPRGGAPGCAVVRRRCPASGPDDPERGGGGRGGWGGRATRDEGRLTSFRARGFPTAADSQRGASSRRRGTRGDVEHERAWHGGVSGRTAASHPGRSDGSDENAPSVSAPPRVLGSRKNGSLKPPLASPLSGLAASTPRVRPPTSRPRGAEEGAARWGCTRAVCRSTARRFSGVERVTEENDRTAAGKPIRQRRSARTIMFRSP